MDDLAECSRSVGLSTSKLPVRFVICILGVLPRDNYSQGFFFRSWPKWKVP
jgi:hypothetical protein